MFSHKSVLLDEVISNLNIKENGVYVDATLGFGGHSLEILKKIKRGHLYGFDQDIVAISYAKEKLDKQGDNYTIINDNFVNLKSDLAKHGVTEVDGILFDLGVSSLQLDDETRGFSYQKDARLDMRMNQSQSLSAYEVVNSYSYHDLKNIFLKYGEEKYASSIANNIVKTREQKKIETTLELVDIIKKSIPAKAKRDKHPAKKVFQAIRIEVNDELNVLDKVLDDAINMLKVNGVLAVITFHSLEDALVMEKFKKYTTVDSNLKKLPYLPKELEPKYKLGKKILPSTMELQENNRAHSATLRTIIKIKE